MFINDSDFRKEVLRTPRLINCNACATGEYATILDSSMDLFKVSVSKNIGSNGKEFFQLTVSNGDTGSYISTRLTADDYRKLVDMLVDYEEVKYRVDTSHDRSTKLDDMLKVFPKDLLDEDGVIKEEYRIKKQEKEEALDKVE